MTPRRTALMALLTVLLVAGRSQPADNTWTNTAGNFTWSGSANNWFLSPGSWDNNFDDTAIFTSMGAGTITASGTLDVRGINFQASGYVINGGTLNLVNGGASVLGIAAGEIRVDPGVSATINSLITGTVDFTKSGTGTLTLGNGNSTYSGNVNINAGTLIVSAQNQGSGATTALGAGTAGRQINVNNGGTLSLTINGALSSLLTINIASGGVVTSTRFNGIGNVNLSGGTLTQASTDTAGTGGVFQGYEFTGAVNASGSAASTISTTNGSGNHLTGEITFNVSGTGGLTVSTPLLNGISLTGSLRKTGAGTLNLTATNSSYGGTTIFEGGVINVASLSNQGVAGSLGNVSNATDTNANTIGLLFRGGTLQYTGSTAQSTNRNIRLDLSGGVIDASGSTPTATVSFTSTSAPNLFFNPGARTLTLTGSNTGNNLFAIPLANQAGSATSLIKSGAGKWVLTGNSTYTGTTSLQGGTLSLGAANAIGTTGTISFAGGTLQFTAANTNDYSTRFSTAAGQAYSFDTNGQNVTLATALTSSGGTLMKFGGGTLTLTGLNTYTGSTTISAGILSINDDARLGNTSGALTLNGGALRFTGFGTVTAISAIRSTVLGASGGTFDTSGLGTLGGNIILIASPISGTGSLTLNAHGDLSDTGGNSNSNLILTGANTFTGAVTIGSGLVDSQSNFGNAANTLTIAGGGLVGTVSTSTVSRGITLSSSGDRVFRIYGASTLTLSGAIGGTGSMRKTDEGTLVLTGNNTYTGGTTVGGGSLSINSDARLGAASGTLTFDGGTLRFTGTGTVTAISATRSTVLGASGGTFDTSGLGTFSANIITIASPISGTGPLTLNAHGSLADNGGGSNSNLILTGANIFAGTVTIGSGLVDSQSNFGNAANTLTIAGGGLVGTVSTSTVSRGITLSGSGDRIFRVYNGSTLTLSGAIDGSASLRKTDDGTLVLTGSNTYAGGTSVARGILQIGDGGTTGAIAGNVTNNAALSFNRSDSVTYSGQISGNGSLTKLGSGTLTLTGNSTYTGITTVSAGTLQVGSGGTTGFLTGNVSTNANLIFNRSDAVTYAGIISGTGGIVKLGTGTLTFTNSSTVGGSVTVNGGTLAIDGGGSLGSGFAYIGKDFGNNGAVTVGGGSGTATWSNTGTLMVAYQGTGTLTITGGGTVNNADGIIGLNSGINGAVTVGGGTGSAAWNNANLFVGYYGQGTLTVIGGGTVTSDSATLGFVDPFSNAVVTVGGGTGSATWNNASSLTVGEVGRGTLTITTGGTVSATALNGGNGNSSVNFDGGTLRITGTDTASNTVNLQSGGGTIDTPNAANTFTITSTISGAGGLTKTGAGNLALTGANTYTGGTTVSGGTLIIDSIAHGGLASPIGASGNASSNLVLGGVGSGGSGTLRYTGTSIAVTDRGMTLGSGGSGIIEVTSAANYLWIRGSITGGGALVKTGPGTLYLGQSATNNYTGGTTVTAGTLANAQHDALPTAGALIMNGGTYNTNGWSQTTGSLSGSGTVTNSSWGNALTVNQTSTTFYSGAITGNLNLVKSGGGSLTLTGNSNTYTGTTTINGGSLIIAASGQVLPNGNNVTVNTGGTLIYGSSGNIDNFSTRLGTLTLNDGTLYVSGGFSLLYISDLLVGNSGGTLDFSGSSASWLTLAGDNTAITVNANSTWIGGGSTHIRNNGSAPAPLTIASGVTLTTSLPLATATGLGYTLLGGGTLYLSNLTSTHAAVYRVENGTLRVDSFSQMGFTDITLAGTLLVGSQGTSARFQYSGSSTSDAKSFTLDTAGGTFNVSNAATTLTLSGVISGSGGLFKSGPGTLIISGTSNTYTGGTTVNAGTLAIAADNPLGAAGGEIVVNALGTVNVTSSFTTTRSYTLNGGKISTAAGQSLTFNNATVGGGFLAGTFATQAGSSNTFAGVTTATSADITLNGTGDALNNFHNGGRLVVSSGVTTATLNGFTNNSNGRLTVGSSTSSQAIVTVTDFVSNGLVTIMDGPSTTTRTQLVNTSGSDIYFGGGSRTFIGTTAGVAAGNLATLNLATKQAIVSGGLLVNNGRVTNGQVVADYGGLVKGSGFFSTTVLTRNGGAFQPGNSPGRTDFGDFEFTGGGVLNFQINNATGVSGPTPDVNNNVSGWGLIRVIVDESSGNLTITSSSTNKFTINLQTLINPTPSGTDNFGAMANFDPNQNWSWTFLTYEGAYSGPTDPAALNAAFRIDTAQFANVANGTFSIVHNTPLQTLSVVYAPVPEPGSLLVIAALALGLGYWWRGGNKHQQAADATGGSV